MAKIKDKRQIEKKIFEIYIIDKELTFVRTITVKKNPHSRNMDKTRLQLVANILTNILF